MECVDTKVEAGGSGVIVIVDAYICRCSARCRAKNQSEADTVDSDICHMCSIFLYELRAIAILKGRIFGRQDICRIS